MNPIRLGEPGRELFGLLQHPPASNARGHGVLVCNPFGQEAIRCHRLLRVLGDRLARDGYHVLRFDYFGTGDSDGDDAEGDLESWTQDVLRADEALRRLAGVARRSWFGIRTGGTVAALASGRAAEPPASLVLWDPVVDGAGYLRELQRAHEAALRLGAAGLATAYRLSRTGAAPVAAEDEALGFPLTPSLRAQLRALDAASLATMRAGRVDLIAAGAAGKGDATIAGDASVPVRRVAIATGIDWATDKAMDSAIVPMEALQSIVACLAEGA